MKANYSLLMSVCWLSVATVFAQEKKEVPTRQESARVSISAKVESIDKDKREVTVKDSKGNEVTLTVDPSVKRFNEIKVGDHIKVDYYVSLAAELREPTAEEKEKPFQKLEKTEKAPADADPSVASVAMYKVVATVEGLDRPTKTVTVKGPRGRYVTARVRDPKNLERMRIGDTMLIAYTEALAVSLEKEKPTDDK